MAGPVVIPIEGVLDKYGVDYRSDRSGNQSVLCPFHEDSHRSASVNLGEGVFKCFTCPAQGSAVTLLMEQEGMGLSEAIRVAQELADAAGASVSRGSDGGDSFLPRRKGSRPGRRAWKSPWTRQ